MRRKATGEDAGCVVAEEQREPTGPLGPMASAVVIAYSKLAGDVLAPFRIVPVQWAILQNCSPTEGATATALSQVLPVDSATVSRNVEQLVRLGLLQRQRLERDRRIVRLTFTDDARALFPEIAQRMKVIDTALLDGVTRDELEGFLRTVQKVKVNAARYSEQTEPDDPS